MNPKSWYWIQALAWSSTGIGTFNRGNTPGEEETKEGTLVGGPRGYAGSVKKHFNRSSLSGRARAWPIHHRIPIYLLACGRHERESFNEWIFLSIN